MSPPPKIERILKMAKFLAVVDHMAHYKKDWTYIRLSSGSKMHAFIEAATKGFQRSDVGCVVVLKRTADCEYRTIARIYPSGTLEEFTDVGDDTWAIDDFEMEN